jgi:hypothetical protein
MASNENIESEESLAMKAGGGLLAASVRRKLKALLKAEGIEEEENEILQYMCNTEESQYQRIHHVS